MPFGLGIWEKRLGTGMREMKDAVAEVDPRRMLEAGDDEKAKAAPKQAQKPPPKPPPASGDGPSTS